MRQWTGELDERKVATVLSLGEEGGVGGGKWDDGVFSSIKQVDIVYGYSYIISIRTEYCDDNGNSILSDKHGGNDDGTLKKVHNFLLI